MAERIPFTRDITTCAAHPDRSAVCWGDVTDEDGARVTVGLCAECRPPPVFVPLSAGEPCRCGPGFCAHALDLGHVGYCGGSRAIAGPARCDRCGVGHQSDAGCWLCRPDAEPWEADNTAAWALLADSGASGLAAFAEQDAAARRGEALTFVEAAQRAAGKVPRG